jgi:hypothetical protein
VIFSFLWLELGFFEPESSPSTIRPLLGGKAGGGVEHSLTLTSVFCRVNDGVEVVSTVSRVSVRVSGLGFVMVTSARLQNSEGELSVYENSSTSKMRCGERWVELQHTSEREHIVRELPTLHPNCSRWLPVFSEMATEIGR